MAYLVGVLIFALGAALSIALHEVGHLVPAKRFGVKCTQYMVGFGPTVWSRRRGETEYGVKAIPLGGYVRMIGMFPPKVGESTRSDRSGRLGLMIDQARRDAQADIGPDDGDRLFYQRSVPKRLVIMLGGPTMNLIIAIGLFTVVLCGHGVVQQTLTLSSVNQCVVPASAAASAQSCTATSIPAPAAAAGLRPGDTITAFAGEHVTSWDQLRALIKTNAGKQVEVAFVRAGTSETKTITPILNQVQKFDGNDVPVKGVGGSPVYESVGFLGVSPQSAVVRLPLTEVPGHIGGLIVQVAGVLTTIPQKMVGVAEAAFGGGARDPNGPISVIGMGRVAGETADVQGSPDSPLTLWDKLAQELGYIAALNLALFLFNLVPLLPLDGGHVAGALWEGLRRQVARLRSRPDPGPVDIARTLPLMYAVSLTLIAMTVLLVYADIVNPVKLSG